jgi:hypothetical protein
VQRNPQQPQPPSGAKQQHPGGDKDKKQPTEADFLTREQDQAKAAISAVLADMKRAVAEGADVREWTRQHPLIMAGTATVAGFIAGMLVMPSKHESVKSYWGEKWEAFQQKMMPPTTATATVGTEAPPAPAAPQAEPPSILGTVVREAMKSLGPMLGGLISGIAAGQAAQPENGHPPDDGADGTSEAAFRSV